MNVSAALRDRYPQHFGILTDERMHALEFAIANNVLGGWELDEDDIRDLCQALVNQLKDDVMQHGLDPMARAPCGGTAILTYLAMGESYSWPDTHVLETSGVSAPPAVLEYRERMRTRLQAERIASGLPPRESGESDRREAAWLDCYELCQVSLLAGFAALQND